MRGRAGLAFAALALAGVLALAVFPARAWMDQRHTRRELAAQVTGLNARNGALRDRAAQLQTDAEIERLARQYNLVKPGEETYFILPRPESAPPEQAPAPPPVHRSKSVWDRIKRIF